MNKAPNRKDEALLLAAALVVSALAWAFWHYLGVEWATLVLLVIVLASLILDNRRLRRQLRERQGVDPR
ncbi:hypothetical protein ASG87_08660 [Frateuria sp. Soil773]|uniref:hypothetical protein n=1 Tax=Frateuria sp. Soil773 TaxID=1736407 RepID=UPI0006FFE7EA|nr:hypothetical protein [Frateuria sp. Soil773]KRE88641.1 hypothetical protein ASG87_08660 [Frateuria sp. Soil773]